MPRSRLTGSRIRERRLDMGLRQARLAELCGVSPSYLNLIEHNRRRIGGKLLNAIAAALDVEPSSLSEGADAGLLDALREAAAELPGARVEAGREDEFAGRFPGWAELVVRQARRIGSLERAVETLNDRLTHDPHLAAALHDILSTVTAIRSASGILAGDEAVDPDWQARFSRNIHEDSRRLTEAAQGLVSYLDAGADSRRSVAAPQEQLDAWLEERGYHFEELEGEAAAEPEALVEASQGLVTEAAQSLALAHLRQYRADAARVPMAALTEAMDQGMRDPGALAQHFGANLICIFRRLAAIPGPTGRPSFGLAICDASGTLILRKPADGFPLPRLGAACPLLPLYQALGRPMTPIRSVVEQAGGIPRQFQTYSYAEPARPAAFDRPTAFVAAMLILPDAPDVAETESVTPVGVNCRICPRAGCVARREPSLLSPSGGQDEDPTAGA